MAGTLSKPASVATSWPRRVRHSSTQASVGLSCSLSDSGENSSPGSTACATSKSARIFMLDGPLEAAGIKMIGDHRGEIGGDVEIQTRGVGVRFQLELLAAMDEFLHQHVDRVFALPSPLHDRRDQGSPVLAHEAGCGFLGN